MRSKVFSGFSASFYKLRKREIYQLGKKFEKEQWGSNSELSQKSDALTSALLHHAYENVPYYRKCFSSIGIGPDFLSFENDWSKVPILEKQVLKEQFEQLTCTNRVAEYGHLNHSGGSTGIPMTFYTDLLQFKMMAAWTNMVFAWCGWQIGEPRVEFWGNKTQILPLTQKERLRVALSGNLILPVYEYDEHTMQKWLEVLNQVRPTVIYGYPSVLADFARWLDSQPLSMPALKGVYCSAEMLHMPQRQIIEKVFDCKVFNQYGSRETPCVACECPHGKMHIFIGLNRVEFDERGNGAGEYGDIIITPLHNYVQPLIRYRLGDVGRLLGEKCSCGRAHPLLDLNIGRSGDIIQGKEGRSIFPSFFLHLLDGQEWIESFQFVQKEKFFIELNIVSNGQENVAEQCEKLHNALIGSIEEQLGGKTKLKVNPVERIDRTVVGKHRFVISEL